AASSKIVEDVIGTGTGGIHVSAEIYGKDDTQDKLQRKNPKVFRTTDRYLDGQPGSLPNDLKAILDSYIKTLEPIAKNWKEQGMSPGQSKGNLAYLEQIKKEMAGLT